MRSRNLLLAAGVILLTTLPAGALPVQAGSKTFTVTTIEDQNGDCDANCSLREAITAANNHAGADKISFNIPGNGPHTIAPNTELPAIADRVTIDGYSQDGAAPNSNPTGGLNSQLQIVLNGSAAGSFATGLRIEPGADGSVVKGLVINDFTGEGIAAGTDLVKIEGNFIGTNAAGTAKVGNSLAGVVINAAQVTVGGTQPGQRNLISGNEGNGTTGVQISSNADNAVVQGNLIGTDKDGTGDLGNGRGISIGANNALIGGPDAAAANVIAFNDERGVLFVSTVAKGNRLLGNSFFANADLGIDLPGGTEDNDGRTANDPKDRDGGPNRLQNCPELGAAMLAGGTTTIPGKLRSTPDTKFTLQFFATPPADGDDEGKLFLGQKTVTTNAKGKVSFTFTTTEAVSAGDDITATATNKQKKDTSEFSVAVGVA